MVYCLEFNSNNNTTIIIVLNIFNYLPEYQNSLKYFEYILFHVSCYWTKI
jgi:hypothetical protein